MVKLHSQGRARIERAEKVSLANGTPENRCVVMAEQAACSPELRQQDWRAQQAAGIDLIAVGDFDGGDPVLAHSYQVGQVVRDERPSEPRNEKLADDTSGFAHDQTFAIGCEPLFAEVAEARALGLTVKPVILGPLSYLWLGHSIDPAFERLELLERLLPVYGEVFARLAAQGVEWVQIDEPILSLDLPLSWRTAFERAYNLLQREPLKKLLAVGEGELTDNLGLATGLPVEGLHVVWPNTVQIQQGLLDRLPAYKILSLGLVEQADTDRCARERRLQFVSQAAERLKERLWLAPERSRSAAEGEFGHLVQAARKAAAAKPAVVESKERTWPAIEAALAKLSATQAGLAAH